MKHELDVSGYAREFEQETDERAMIRFAGDPKQHRNHREEKVRKFRRGYKTVHFDKESAWARKIWNKKVRNNARQTLKNAKDFEDIEIFDLKKTRSEEHTSELQSRENLVCRLLLEKKKNSR